MNRRTFLFLLAGLGLVSIGIVVWAILFAQPATVEGYPTVVYFHSGRCEHCSSMNPIVNEVSKSYRGQVNLVSADLDQPSGKELAMEHHVIGFPTLLLLDSDGNQVSVLRGVSSYSVVEKAFDRLAAGE